MEYECIKDNLLIYFVKENSMLKQFEPMDIEHVLRIRNQKANDLNLWILNMYYEYERQTGIRPELSTPKMAGEDELPGVFGIFENFAINNIENDD